MVRLSAVLMALLVWLAAMAAGDTMTGTPNDRVRSLRIVNPLDPYGLRCCVWAAATCWR